MLPHLQTLVSFFTTAIPTPTLLALIYRLAIMHFAGRILPSIGDDYWEREGGVDSSWEDRPVRLLSAHIQNMTERADLLYSHQSSPT